MRIGGWQKFSLVDYPSRLSAVIFTQGCNFRCPYCHNPELVEPKLFQSPESEEAVLSFLKSRVGCLDGVVVTGGEPTLQPDLLQFLKKIKKLGFLIKLDTNGSQPDKLKLLLKEKLVDYWAMDLKGPEEKYSEIIRTNLDFSLIKQSIDLIRGSGKDYEFRTTVVKGQLSGSGLMAIGQLIKGAECYVLQAFIPAEKILDPAFRKESSCDKSELEAWANQLEQKYVKRCLVR